MGAFAVFSTRFHGRVQTAIVAGGVVLGYIFEIIALRAVGRQAGEYRVALNLFRLIEALEKDPDKWRELEFRARLNWRIERAAMGLETLPYALRLRDPVTLTAIFTSVQRKAAAIRALKIWVAQPNPFTYTGFNLAIEH
jgi:hypothetical protein